MDTERRTKILFVITKSNFGGAQRYVFDLATNLPRSTYQVAVACGPDATGKTGRLSYLLNEKEIPTIEVPALTRDINIIDDIRAFFALTGLLLEEKPDIVHLNSSKAAGLGALAARIAGIKRIVFTIHGLPENEDRSWFAQRAIAAATWLTALLSHSVITVSEDAFEKVRARSFLFGKTVLIHNGVTAIDFLSSGDARRELRAIDPSIPDDFLVGSIGELHRNKGFDYALAALAQTDAHLVIVGDGEERDALKRQAEQLEITKRVHFLGFIPAAAKYLRAFDVFLLSSRKEGLPYVLLEAGMAEVPIIASDIPGVRDIVLPDFTGIRSNATGYAAAIERMKDATFARPITEEMAKRVRTNFSLRSMLEQTERCYAE